MINEKLRAKVRSPQGCQNIVRTAGGHIYNTVPGDLFVHHRDDLICLHGIEDNANIIALPYEAEVKDLLSGIPVEKKDRKFTVKLNPGETKLLQVTKKPKSL